MMEIWHLFRDPIPVDSAANDEGRYKEIHGRKRNDTESIKRPNVKACAAFVSVHVDSRP